MNSNRMIVGLTVILLLIGIFGIRLMQQATNDQQATAASISTEKTQEFDPIIEKMEHDAAADTVESKQPSPEEVMEEVEKVMQLNKKPVNVLTSKTIVTDSSVTAPTDTAADSLSAPTDTTAVMPTTLENLNEMVSVSPDTLKKATIMTARDESWRIEYERERAEHVERIESLYDRLQRLRLQYAQVAIEAAHMTNVFHAHGKEATGVVDAIEHAVDGVEKTSNLLISGGM